MGNGVETDKQRWLEIGAVVLTGLLKYVFMDWLEMRVLYIGVACLFWTFYIFKRYKGNILILKHWGFRKDYFKSMVLFISPFAMVTIVAIVWYGISNKTIIFNWHLIPTLVFYPLWGTIQQFLILALVAGNLHSITAVQLKEYQIILLISLLFALVHYPSVALMGFTFFMELVLASAYFKWRNLWVIGLYHGWVASLLLFFVLGRDAWNELWSIF